MNTQEQAYVKGFVKRAAEYGFNENEALDLLKEASFGKMLKGLAKGDPHKFNYSNKSYNLNRDTFNSILKKHPELRRGADIDALADLNHIAYRMHPTPEDQHTLRAIAELTGKNPAKFLESAADASQTKRYLQNLKDRVRENITPQNTGGFAEYVKGEKANSGFENTKNKMMQLLARKK